MRVVGWDGEERVLFSVPRGASGLAPTLLVVLKSTHRPDDIRRHATVLSRFPAENKKTKVIPRHRAKRVFCVKWIIYYLQFLSI